MQATTPTLQTPSRRVTATSRAVGLLLVGLLATAFAMAEKSDGDGNKNGKAEKHQKQGKKDKKDKHDKENPVVVEVHQGRYFQDNQRTVVRTYYTEQYRVGRCPPGLAKKNNGCMPPGQARKWAVGQPLPREVVYYSVPAPVVVQLGPPPSGHRYVRVATDILLMAIGTRMVVDAINDLGRM